MLKNAKGKNTERMESAISKQNGMNIMDRKIKIMKTKPSVHEERKVLITIGEENHESPMFQNVELWKYGDIFCYHENIWETRPNLKKIAYLWVNSEKTLDAFKEHIGDVYYIIARKEFIDKHDITSKRDEWKLTGILPLEDLIQYHPIYYISVKKSIENGKFHPSSISYSLALSYSKNYIYHFENQTPDKPEHYNIFGDTHIYSSTNPEHSKYFNEYFAPIYLFQQYYIPKDPNRRKEINYCMKKNIKSGFFDRIILLNEKIYDKYDLKELEDPRVNQVNLKRRMTYQDVINITKHSLPEHCYVIIANSDIYFQETLFSMFNINLNKTLLALLRFDVLGDLYDKEYQQINIFGPRSDSQDVWIFKKQDDLPEDAGFSLGVNGCDNAVASTFFKKKFRVLNPAFNIQTMHVHMSDIRTYNKNAIQYYPFYTHIEPHSIYSKEHKIPDKDLVIYETSPSVSYNQLYPHYSQEIRTFMNYAKKKHGFAPEFQQNIDSTSYSYNRVYHFKNMNCDNLGSIYNKNCQYTLLGDKVREVNNSFLKRIRPYSRAILISQYGDDISDEPKGLFWFLKNSLPKMLVMAHTTVANETFIANIDHTLVQYLQKINLLLKFVKASKNVDIFAQELFVPQPVQEMNYPREYVNLIRKHYCVNSDANENNNLVVLVRNMEFYDTDESWDEFKREVKQKVSECLKRELTFVEVEDKKENYVSSLDIFKQALVVIGYRCEIMANCIFTPKNALVFEIAYESTPDLQLWNLCAAAEHRYTLVAHKREPKPRQLFMILKKLKMAIETIPWDCQIFVPEVDVLNEKEISNDITITKEEYKLSIRIHKKVRDCDKVKRFARFIRECENTNMLEKNTIEYVDTISSIDDENAVIEYEYIDKKCTGNIESIDAIFNITDLSGLYQNQYISIEDKKLIVCNEFDGIDKDELKDYQFVFIESLNNNQLCDLYSCFTLGTIPIITQEVKEYLMNLSSNENMNSLELQEGINYLLYDEEKSKEEREQEIENFVENLDINRKIYISMNNYRFYNNTLSQGVIIDKIKNILRKL